MRHEVRCGWGRVRSSSMSPFAGPLFAAAILLLVAGAAKVATPAATRVALRTAGLPSAPLVARGLGVVECAIAVSALAAGGRIPAVLVTLTYLGFAGFSAQLAKRSRGTADCGCFGASSAPVGTLHVVLNLATAAAVAGAVVKPSDDLLAAASDTPWAGAPFYAVTALLAWATYVALTALPALVAATKTSGAAP